MTWRRTEQDPDWMRLRCKSIRGLGRCFRRLAIRGWSRSAIPTTATAVLRAVRLRLAASGIAAYRLTLTPPGSRRWSCGLSPRPAVRAVRDRWRMAGAGDGRYWRRRHAHLLARRCCNATGPVAAAGWGRRRAKPETGRVMGLALCGTKCISGPEPIAQGLPNDLGATAASPRIMGPAETIA